MILMPGGQFQFYMRACKQILIYLGGGNGIETVATVSYSFATPPFLLAHSGALCAIRSVFGLPNELCILRTNWQIV